MRHFLYQLWLWLDQGMNVLLLGYADETLSARCYRQRSDPPWGALMRVLDTIYFWQRNHCESAYGVERSRKQLPQEYHA